MSHHTRDDLGTRKGAMSQHAFSQGSCKAPQQLLELESPNLEDVKGFPVLKSCNGRALDRVTKQKHRPNRQKCLKNVRNCVLSPFGPFFGDFVDIHFLWAVQRFARYIAKGCLSRGVVLIVGSLAFAPAIVKEVSHLLHDQTTRCPPSCP